MRWFFALCCLGYSAANHAGTGSGQIVAFTPVALANGTEFFVVTLQNMTGQPPCAGGVGTPPFRFALSAADPKYKTTLAAMMAAYFSGSSVYAVGLGTCNTYSQSEDLGYMCFNGGVPC